MDGDAARGAFIVRVNADSERIRFCVIWRPPTLDGRECGTLREALTAHRDDLSERLDAVRALLGGTQPERADRLFAAMTDIAVTEIVLPAPPDAEPFEELMRRAFEGRVDRDE